MSSSLLPPDLRRAGVRLCMVSGCSVFTAGSRRGRKGCARPCAKCSASLNSRCPHVSPTFQVSKPRIGEGVRHLSKAVVRQTGAWIWACLILKLELLRTCLGQRWGCGFISGIQHFTGLSPTRGSRKRQGLFSVRLAQTQPGSVSLS